MSPGNDDPSIQDTSERASITSAPQSSGHRPVSQVALGIGIVMAITLNALETIAVTTVMPAVTEDLDGDSLYGAAFSAYMLASLVSLVAAGEQADRRGPARPFLAGVVLFAVGLTIVGLAPTMPVVVLGRVVQGAGGGALASIAYVAIGRAWPVERQARMFAILSAAWVLPSLIGPAFAGAVTTAFGWRWVFLGLLPVIPVLVVLALPSLARLPPRLDPAAGPSRLRPAITLAAGVGLVVAGLQTDHLAIGLPAALVGALVAAPAARRLLPRGTWRFAPGLAAAVAVRICVNISFLGADTFIPLAATRFHGASTFIAGMLLIGASLVWTLGSAVAARRSGTTAPGKLVRIGFVIVAGALVATSPILLSGTPLVFTFVSWAVAGFGVGLVFTTTSAAGMGAAPPGQEGLVGGQLGMADALGLVAITGVGGALVGLAGRTSLSLPSALGIVFAISTTVAIVGAVLGRRVGSVPLGHEVPLDVASPPSPTVGPGPPAPGSGALRPDAPSAAGAPTPLRHV